MPTPGHGIFLKTFGCQMNELDSDLVRSQLRALGYRFTDDWRRADVVLYNTCSVREHAEQKVWSRIGEVGVLKRERPGLILGVLGCLAEREAQAIFKKYPQVDLLCGPGELDKVPLLIENAVKTALPAERVALGGDTHRRSSTLAAAEDKLELLDLSRSFDPDEHRGSAYVRITRGCNKFCTYCVVPFTRGAEVHRPPDHIVEECRKLVDAGVVEITLLGQTVNHYHYHHGASVTVAGLQQPQIGGAPGKVAHWAKTDRVTTFADLLARVHDEVPGLLRLRFVTSFPRDFGDDVLDVMAVKPRICRYLHLPVQSGSDRLLRLMNRGYTVAEYRELLDRIASRLPEATLASDLICGFPTETEEDHALTCELMRQAKWKNCFVFKYSPRPGTAAFDKLPDDVPDEVKRQRNNELLAIQSKISADLHASYVGRTVRVFVESISHKARKAQKLAAGSTVLLGWEKPVTQLCGRTDGDLIVMFDADASLVGRIVDVAIDSAAPLTLFGRLADQPVPAAL
ncbi:MAG: MiaB/RimO family radical SAM methylthiotransferase [Phycisphaeraceae bacterium]|nr:MiaB/RimO family radical SAM methylthiotransferase [Phycisphaeraceae bacterium]